MKAILPWSLILALTPLLSGAAGLPPLQWESLTEAGQKPSSSKAPEAGFWRVIARPPQSPPRAFDFLPLLEPFDPTLLPPLPAEPARALEVRVTDASGRPLTGAKIRLEPVSGSVPEGVWGPAPLLATSDRDGVARLATAPSFPLRLTAEAPGFVTEAQEIPPQMTERIQVSLEAGVTRTIEVRDEAGKPVARVSAETVAGVRLGVTDGEGRLSATLPRANGAEIRLVAPDCRGRQLLLPTGSPAVVTLSPSRRVEGRVTDRVSRKPLAGAWVWAEGVPACATKSDAEGRYTLALPGFGTPKVRGAAAGHRPASIAAEEVNLALAPSETRAAFGRVVDLGGKPVAGAQVLLTPSAGADSLEGIEARRRATLQAKTDGNGRFRLPRVGPGPFDLEARAPGWLTTRVRQVTLPPGPGDADLGVLSLAAGAVLEGRVVDLEGAPLEGARVAAAPTSGGAAGEDASPEGVTDSRGAFALTAVREGERLTLRVTRRGFAPRMIPGLALPLAEPLTVELTPAARISGTVLDEAGEVVEPAKLILTEARREGDPPRARFVAVAAVDGEGSFELVDLAPGRYRLSAVAPGYRPETRDSLDLTAGSGLEGISLVLRRGSVVEGRVQAPDGAPVAGARVLVLGQTTEADLGLAGRPEAWTDGEGHYQLGGLLEGEVTVAAEHAGFLPARRTVNVAAGTTALDLRLRGGVAVSGRVVGSGGPVSGSRLRLTAGEGVESPAAVTSGAGGTFQFDSVAEGVYRLETETPGYASARQEVGVGASPVTGLEVRLDRGGSVTGRILGLSFQDLARVQVVAQAPDRPGQAGEVDHAGRYRIAGLTAGEWRVIASLGSRQTGALADVQGGETRLDLELADGFVLSGRVERAGAPLGGALVRVESGDGSGGNAVTGADGRFRVEGLRAGPYSLTALEPRSHASASQPLEIAGDREVVVALPVQN